MSRSDLSRIPTLRRKRWRLRGWVVVAAFLLLAATGLLAWILRKAPSEDPFQGRTATNSFQKGQCTWYTFDRALQNGWRIRFAQSYGRHAKEWPKLIANGTTIEDPQVGALMAFGPWPGNPYGHVAYVESVEDHDHRTISHANMSAGAEWGKLDGFTIRRAKMVRKPDGVAIEGGRTVFKPVGFVAPQPTSPQSSRNGGA